MFAGSLVAIVTPMRADGAIDFEAWTRLLEFHVANGTDGIVVGGTTGESATLRDAELRELAALRAAQQGPEVGSRTAIEEKLKNICDAALQGKRVDIHDNLFEIGASSLKLIEIHEQIDREYPGKVDLTELFDFPTIAELAQHLQSKLASA